MKPTHIEHIGIAVKNLEESIKYYQDVLGLECYNIEEVKKYDDEKLNEVIKKSPYYKATSNDVDWLQKVKIQSLSY